MRFAILIFSLFKELFKLLWPKPAGSLTVTTCCCDMCWCFVFLFSRREAKDRFFRFGSAKVETLFLFATIFKGYFFDASQRLYPVSFKA
jgi:hypothetical protein